MSQTSPTKKTSFVITDDQYDGLQQIAEQDVSSMSYHVRRAIEDYIEKWFNRPSTETEKPDASQDRKA
jgi:predicted transcriptional regulator